jgi:hypothetical protein
MSFIQKYRKDAGFRDEVLEQQKKVNLQATEGSGSESSYRGRIPVDFRFADEDDAQDIAGLVNEAYAVEKGDKDEAFKNCDCTTTAEVSENMGGPQGAGCIWYLAEARDKASTLLAAACYFTNPQKAAGQMNMFAVKATHQQLGVGTQLLAAVEQSLIVGMGVRSMTIALPNHRVSVAKWLGGRGYKKACEAPFPSVLNFMLTKPTVLHGYTKELGPVKERQTKSATATAASSSPTKNSQTSSAAKNAAANPTAEQKRKQQLAARMKSLSVTSTGPPSSSSAEAAAGAAAAEAVAVKAAEEAVAASRAKAVKAKKEAEAQSLAEAAQKKADDAQKMMDRLAMSTNGRCSSTYDDELLQMLQPSPSAPPPPPDVRTTMTPAEQVDYDSFIAWAKLFEKKYKTATQKVHRFGIWRKNKASIDSHNRRQRANREVHAAKGGAAEKQSEDDFYEAELNLFADLTDGEYAKFEKFKEKEDAANKANAARVKELRAATDGARQQGGPSSLSDLGAFGAAEVTSRGKSIKREGGSLSGPCTRGPVETELYSKVDEEQLTKGEVHAMEEMLEEQDKMEEEGEMYGMSVQDKKGFLVAKLKEDMIGVEEFQAEMAKVNELEQEQLKAMRRRRGGGAMIQNNYEIKGIGQHGALGGFSVA